MATAVQKQERPFSLQLGAFINHAEAERRGDTAESARVLQLAAARDRAANQPDEFDVAYQRAFDYDVSDFARDSHEMHPGMLVEWIVTAQSLKPAAEKEEIRTQWECHARNTLESTFAEIEASDYDAPTKEIMKTWNREEAARLKPVKFLSKSYAEMLREPPRCVEWLVPDVLERAVIGLLVGPRGSFKSFFALDLAMRVALKGEPIYLISAEGEDLRNRIAAWLQFHAPAVDGSTLPIYTLEKRQNLSTQEGVEEIRQDCAARKIRPVLFAIDTLSKTTPGLDTNSGTDMKDFLRRIDNGLKREFKASVIVICHVGHGDKTRASGTYALGADSDTEWVVTRPGDGDTISITRERFKSSPELPPLILERKVIDLGFLQPDGKPATSLVLVPGERKSVVSAKPRSPNAEALLGVATELMAVQDEVTKTELKAGFKALERVGSSQLQRTFNRALDELTKRGPLTEKAGKVSFRTVRVPVAEFDEELLS